MTASMREEEGGPTGAQRAGALLRAITTTVEERDFRMRILCRYQKVDLDWEEQEATRE